MNYIIRKANREDVKVLDALLTKLIQDERNYDNNINENFVVNNYYEKIIDDSNKCFLVAETNNNGIIGFLYGYIQDNGNVCINNVAKLDALFVLDEYRNLGIAKNLIAEFKLWVTSNNTSYIEVTVLNSNVKAYNLYENIGFKNVKSTMIIEIN